MSVAFDDFYLFSVNFKDGIRSEDYNKANEAVLNMGNIKRGIINKVLGLEEENERLRSELDKLKDEISKLKKEIDNRGDEIRSFYGK